MAIVLLLKTCFTMRGSKLLRYAFFIGPHGFVLFLFVRAQRSVFVGDYEGIHGL